MSDAAPLGQVFYPACMVNLTIRFDAEFNADARVEGFLGNEEASTPLSGMTVPELRTRLSSLRTATELNKVNANGIGQIPIGADLFDAQANLKGSSILGRIPLRAAIELNNIRKPGTFNLTFDYKDLPIDPRLIRSVGIEIYLDTVSASDFGKGMRHLPQGSPTGRATEGYKTKRFEARAENLVLKGVVDNWSVSHSASGSIATLEGRDLVGVMLNTPVTVELLQQIGPILNKPIDEVVRAILATVGTFTDLLEVQAAPTGSWNTDDGNPPIVRGAAKDLAPTALLDVKPAQKNPRVRSSADGTEPRVSLGADQDKLSVWDLITRYCNLVSAVPYFNVEETEVANDTKTTRSVLRIQPQWGLYDYYSNDKGQFNARGPGSPFTPSRSFNNREFRVRKLMYGRNIEELTYERKYQGITARAVEVVSYDTSSDKRGGDRMISAISQLTPSYAQKLGLTPPLASQNARISPGEVPTGLSKQDEVLRVYVKGVKDIKQLQSMADGLFEEIMRGETSGSVRTRSLASFGGGNEDPDLLRIRPRDPLELSVDIRPGNAALPASDAELIRQTRQSIAALQEDIYRRTGDYNLSRAIAYSSRNAVAQLQNAFRVNSVSFDWDVNSGISISLDFHNYIMARNAVMSSPQPASGTATQGRASAVRAKGSSRRRSRRRSSRRSARSGRRR